jgi:hypothetical protein
MPEPLGQPTFEPHHEPTFEAHRARLGLTGAPFDYFFSAVEKLLGDYPYKYSEEVPDSEGIRMLPTQAAFPDIPALYVYYRVRRQPNQIIYVALSPAWSKADVV